jgi:CheY-like chemotaxis protein
MTKPYSVLVVDDESILRDVCEIVLSSAGYRIYSASNGAEALAILQDASPDIILLDLFMPVMDGRVFLENFDKQAHPRTRVIVYSNASDKNMESEMIKLGADSVVLKSSLSPTDLSQLVADTLVAR